MFTAPVNGHGATAIPSGADDSSLEAVELEIALSLQDLREHSFRDCVENAAGEIGGEILFEMRTEHDRNYQKAIAVSFRRGADQHVFLVLLSRDGNSMKLETSRTAKLAVAGLAQSFNDVSRLLRT